MRFLYAFLASAGWGYFLVFLAKVGFIVSFEQFILTTSIVVAGALAGGK